MTREEFYASDRGEREYYIKCPDEELEIPLTNDGFEAILEKAAAAYSLLVDDRLRSWCSAFFHHIPNDKMTFKLSDLEVSLYRSHSNNMTWDIDQAAKLRETLKLKEKQEQEKPTSANNIVPIQ